MTGTVDPRLSGVLNAPSEEAALDAFSLLWESLLAARVRAYLLSRKLPVEVRSDIEAETYLRICRALLKRRPQASGKAPTPPPHNASAPAVITDVEGYTIAGARSLLYNYYLAQNPPWRQLQLHVITDLKQGGQVARWRQELRWIAGLSAWKGSSFRAKSPRAQAFLNADHSTFRREALRNREPTEFVLVELMIQIFRWIDSPLWQNSLVGHLLKLYRQEATLPLSWEELCADGELQEQSLWYEDIANVAVTRQALREMLGQDGLLNRVQRGVLLLKLDILTLTEGLGLTLSQTAASLGVEFDALFGAQGELLLPMPDDRIAMLLHIEGTKTTPASDRVATHYRMGARRKLEQWLAGAR
jgi:hypothetical protein